MSNPFPPNPHKAALIDAALRVIARTGPEGLTLGEVAQEANSDLSHLQTHFHDEKALLVEALRHAGLRSLSRMQQPYDHNESATLAALRNILNSPENQSQDYVWVMFWNSALASEGLKAPLSEINQLHRTAWMQLIERDMQQGMLRRDLDPELEADRLMLLIDGLALRSALELSAWPPQRQLELLTDSLGLLQEPLP